MKAYEFGILILCADGILRRVFPRIFIYSADYPEKYVGIPDGAQRCSTNFCVYLDAFSLVSSVLASTRAPIAQWTGATSGRWA